MVVNVLKLADLVLWNNYLVEGCIWDGGEGFEGGIIYGIEPP